MAQNIAYGFVDLQHLFKNRVAGINDGTRIVNDAIRQSAQAYSQMVDTLLSELCVDTTQAKEHFLQPGGGTMQPLDEFGSPLPVRQRLGYDVAYPIKGAGTAFGSSRVARALQTVEEANQRTVDAENRDRDWLKRHLLAGLLTSTSYAYFDQTNERMSVSGLGNLTVMPLANGDGTTYVKRGGTVDTDNHYLAQGVDISDGTNPFESIGRTLREHPGQENGRVVCYVAEDLVADIGNLAAFVEPRDSMVQLGANDAQMTASAPSTGFGDEYIGYIRGRAMVHIVAWGELPSGYMVATVQGAQPLARRQYPATELQGLFQENYSPDGAIQETRLIRYCGFGVRNRTAAVAVQIGSASYTNPADFTAPLAV